MGITTSASDAPTPARVVTVEDDPDVRALLRVLFRRSDRFDLVAEAKDGDGAVEIIVDAGADIVLLDLLLPGLDGRDLLPTLVEKAPETMVAVLSALRAEDEAERSLSAGAFAYLEKSLLGPQLIDELVRLHSRFQRALMGETVWAPEIRSSPDPPP